MTDQASSAEIRYQVAVKACIVACLIVTQHDIPGMLEAIERAHSIGPFLDPTLYRDKVGAMEQDKEILRAALPLFKLREKINQHVAAQASTEEG